MTENPEPCPECGHSQTPDFKEIFAVGETVGRKILIGYSCKRDHSACEFRLDEYYGQEG